MSARPAATLHASGGWSGAWYDAPDDVVGSTLLAWLQPWLGSATVLTWQVTRWRYARPRDLVAQASLVARLHGAPVAFADDGVRARQDRGCARSGLAAAEALLDG
ncbi:MAG TPA: hypothetical protein VK923_19005 [Euzebyales bacterium]|nr:hypothetical protein [Euzebyales bacterium]